MAALYTQLDKFETIWTWFQSQPLNVRSYSALSVGAWCHVFLVTVPVMTRSARSIWNVIDVLALDLQEGARATWMREACERWCVVPSESTKVPRREDWQSRHLRLINRDFSQEILWVAAWTMM